MAGELGAVVEGDGPAPLGREGSQQLGDGIGHALGVLGGQGTGEQQAGVAFLNWPWLPKASGRLPSGRE